MTVSSLVKKLQRLDGNAEVKLRITDEEYNTIESSICTYEADDGVVYLDGEVEE